MRLKLWLNKAFGLAESISRLAPSTIATRRRALDRTIDDIIATPPSRELTMQL
jgi:transposase